MSSQLNSIENIYDSILRKKKFILGEADISGIDELVYNPATKVGGTIGHGYDGGKKVTGITWKNHDDHLHIGFTNREVAMAVIDKADSMGLKTTENPYAKRDPNGKVDKVHTDGSFHYKNFAGDPPVGAGVDISGNANTITELIKWIDTTYAGKSLSNDALVDAAGGATAAGVTGAGAAAVGTAAAAGVATGASGASGSGLSYGKLIGMSEMLKTKKQFQQFIYEASANSDNVFDDTSFKWGGGVEAHSSRPPYNWESDNAWDLMVPAGTPVYALASGKVIKTGGSLVRKKTVWGLNCVIQSDDNEFFYTHFDKLGPNIQVGNQINKGDLVGIVGTAGDGWPEHVHVGIRKGDISAYMDRTGNLVGHTGGKTGQVSTDTASSTGDTKSGTSSFSKSTLGSILKSATKGSSREPGRDTALMNMLTGMGSMFGMKESIGKRVSEKYDTVTIPANHNPKIFSPVRGKIDNTKYVRGCPTKTVTIRIEKNLGFLQYCGITDIKVRNGESVNVGELLGKTSQDVEVVYFDKSYSRTSLRNDTFDGLFLDKKNQGNDDEDSERKFKENPTPRYYDPALAAIPSMILGMFQDKKDEKTGEVEKRWGYATDKKPVDPWIINSISKPFQKIGKAIGTNKSVKESKKIQEDIERIKKLLK